MQPDEKWIAARIAEAPPLSPGQRDQLAALFGGGGAEPMNEAA